MSAKLIHLSIRLVKHGLKQLIFKKHDRKYDQKWVPGTKTNSPGVNTINEAEHS